MALLQCMDFLKKYPHIKLVEDKDTAETARERRKAVERNCSNRQ
jgi:prephenate dehydratase